LRCAAKAALLAAGLLLAQGGGWGVAGAAAQAVGPEWHRGWSPLLPPLDLPPALPAAPRAPSLLTAPPLRLGLHWTAGNPAGLAWETEDERQEFLFASAGESGEYRRMADPGTRARTASFAGGWQRLPGGTVLAGGITAGRDLLRGGADAGATRPHTSSPHLLVDTSGTSLRQMEVRMDGAAGWEGGGWAVGAALGYEAADTRTEGGGVFRSFRHSLPAASLGGARRLGPVRLGVHARWQGGSEFVSLAPGQEVLRVYRLAGYADPRAVEHTTCCESRTIRSRSQALGGSVAGRLGGAEWVVFGESAALRETQAALLQNDPPTNDWSAEGGTAGAAAAFGALGGRLEVLLDGRYRWLLGESTRHEFAEEGVLYEADESLLRLRGEGRYALAAGWRAGATAFLDRGAARREEFESAVLSDLAVWSYGGAAELAAPVTGAWSAAGSLGVARYVPIGGVPDPVGRNEAFRKYIARDYMVDATPAFAWGAAGTLAWTPGHSSVWLRGEYGSAAPTPTGGVIAETPQGHRASWNVRLGITLGS
jgi:hypothetical protein